MGVREITYGIDRQGNPALLSEKESIAQQFINAVFLIPGNIPNLPIGLDVMDYLFKTSSSIQKTEILGRLKQACGDNFINDNISSLECGVVNANNEPTFWLCAHLNVPDEEKILALVVRGRDDNVHFNYGFLSEGIKKAYGMN